MVKYWRLGVHGVMKDGRLLQTSTRRFRKGRWTLLWTPNRLTGRMPGQGLHLGGIRLEHPRGHMWAVAGRLNTQQWMAPDKSAFNQTATVNPGQTDKKGLPHPIF